MHYFTYLTSKLGRVTIQASERGISGVWFETHTTLPSELGQQRDDYPLLVEAATQLEAYFRGERRQFSLPVDMHGTEFQKAVWQALMTIPYGETWSYAQLASVIGRPKAVRAVGSANGKNPISIIVPCHRVIGANGTLTGYAGGVERKAELLRLEGATSSAKVI
jgi:methylated-DNA-[protein]-cysteine S-methyltransferase